MKHLLITKCSDRLMWYSHLVGQTLPLVREDEQFFWSRELTYPFCINIINKTDVTIIEDTNGNNASSVHNDR